MVVPERGWEYVLTELHGGHPGITRMKALARGLVWWPGLDDMIERVVKDYPQCQEVHPTPPVQPMQPWSWLTCPWSQLHFDFARPFDERIFLVIVDGCNTNEDSHSVDHSAEARNSFCQHGGARVSRNLQQQSFRSSAAPIVLSTF